MARPFSDHSFDLYLAEGLLAGCRCTRCNARFVPPRPLCPSCRSEAMEWTELSGRGRLAAFACIAIGSSAMRAEGYDRRRPYCSGVVALEEGGRVDALILGVDPAKPETISVGMPLEAKFLHREGAPTRLVFEPAKP